MTIDDLLLNVSFYNLKRHLIGIGQKNIILLDVPLSGMLVCLFQALFFTIRISILNKTDGWNIRQYKTK